MFGLDERRALARRARFLSERLASLRGSHADSSSDEIAVDPAALKYLDVWSRAFAPADPAAFGRRLSWDGLSPEGALAVLSDSIPGDESWLDSFERLAGRLAVTNAGARDVPYGDLWYAFTAAAVEELHARRPGVRAELSDRALDAFARQLAKELAFVGELMAHSEFRAASGINEIDASTMEGDERYRSFIARTLRDRCRAVALKYPVWARHTTIVATTWIASLEELLERLDRDRAELAATFYLDADLIADAQPGLSDPHHGRRRVAALTFGSGLRLVYKPRSVACERAFNDVLAWLNARGLQPTQPVTLLVEREDYGWIQYIEHSSFDSTSEVRDYFRRGGGLLCLTSVFRGRDLHWENVIASARGPVIVDAELLLQPRAPGETEVAPLASGLLSFLQSSPSGDTYDIGGMRGDIVPISPTAERAWLACGTDAIRFVEQRKPVGPKSNRVLLAGAVQRPEDYAEQVVEGFVATYELLLQQRESLLADDGPLSELRAVRTRVLHRPSNQYAAVLQSLCDPKFQKDARLWGSALDSTNRRYKSSLQRPRGWPLAVRERESLERLDIPYFTTSVSGTAIEEASSILVDNHFEQSGADAVAAAVTNLSRTALARELHTLKRALGESTTARFATALSIVGGQGLAGTRATLLSVATWVAEECLNRVPEDIMVSAPQTARRPARLYDGTSGRAVFFAGLAAVTADPRWKQECDRAAAELLSAAAFAPAEASGAASGYGSLIYAATLIGRLTGDRAYFDAARGLAESMTVEALATDPHNDVADGIAGALLALLSLHRADGGPRLAQCAMQVGGLLLERQQAAADGAAWRAPNGAMLAGFAHGAAGIAYALARLYALTGAEEYLRAIHAAHTYERHVYSPADHNWPIMAAPDGESGAFMATWCHGAPGIAMARSYMTALLEDDTVAHEASAALHTTVRVGASQVDHLCCGNLGRADLLLTSGRMIKSRQPMEAAMKIAGIVVRNAVRRGHFRLTSSGFEYRMSDQGFFKGLTGIGYTLLRLGYPDRLPSVLAFEV